MQQYRYRTMLAMVALAGAVWAVAGAASAQTGQPSEPRTIIERARSMVEDFRTGGTSSEYSANLARADAALVMPVMNAGADAGVTGSAAAAGGSRSRPAVLVVRDGVFGPWSDPAFYRVQAPEGDAPYPGFGVLFLITRGDAVERLQDGSATLGSTGLKVDPINVGVDPDPYSDPMAHMVAFVDVSEASVAMPKFEGWRIEADAGLNRQSYSQDLSAKQILSRGAAGVSGSESLLDALRIAGDHGM